MTIAEMEIKRSDLYSDYLAAIGTEKEKAALKALDLMDEIMEAMEGYEAEEEADTAANWDEYMLDLKIDMAREDALAYER